MLTETWLPVVGHEGLYEVSDRGQVRRIAVIYRAAAPGLLTPTVDPVTGYRKVGLRLNGVRRTRPVHVLVCQAFHGPKPSGQEVLHGDGNKANCDAGNLRWGTRRENNLDAVRHLTNANARKTECINGHPLVPENLYDGPGRKCRECGRARAAAQRQRKRQVAD